MNYKETIYTYYRSRFKGTTSKVLLEKGASKLNEILEPWVAEIPRDGLVVDLGCGAGELLMALQKLGFTNLKGCDLSAEQVAIAKSFFPEVRQVDLFAFIQAQKENSLNIVTLFDVVEHLTRQETFDLLSIIFQKLKPGGSLIIHLPNGLSPLVGHVYWSDITHEWCLTPQSAQTLCAVHGFENFEAVEHLGASKTIKGAFRKIAWALIKKSLRFYNFIETGFGGGNIWTRNFAFRVKKPSYELEER